MLTRQTASPYTSAADYLASKVYWTIRVAADQFQVRWALDLITAFVNKRVNGTCESLYMSPAV
jgi:DNA repair/transcription protein MET18/MMS19